MTQTLFLSSYQTPLLSYLALVGFQSFLQLIHQHALLVHLYLYKGGLIGLEGVQSAKVAGAFGDNDVTLVDEQHTGHIQTLLGAAGNQNIGNLSLEAAAYE